jgi:hypothetical protein
MIEMLCRDKAEDRVAEEFQALIVEPRDVGVLV